jgi:hypothetical protein
MQKDNFFQFIEKIDFVGPTPIIYANSEPRFKTFFGGIISILSFFLILAAVLYFTILTLTRANYTIVYNELVNRNTFLSINEDNPLIYGMFSVKGYPLTENYVTFKAIYNEMKGLNFSMTNINMVPCNEKTISPSFMGLIGGSYQPLLPFFWCIDPEELKNRPIYGVKGQPNDMAWYDIHAIICANGTSEIVCANQTSLNSEMETAFITFAFKDHQMDHNKVHNPGTAYMKSFSYNVNPLFLYKYTFRYRNLDYSSDLNFILSSEYVNHYFTMEDNFFNVITSSDEIRFPGTIGITSVSLSEKKPKFFRTYDKIQNLLANLGGILKAIFFFNYIIQKVFLEQFLTEYLTNYLYQFEKKEGKKKKVIRNGIQNSVRRYSKTVNEATKIDHSSLRNIYEEDKCVEQKY